MAEFNISNAGEVLKTVYLPPMQEALNTATILLSRIQKKTKDLSGDTWKFPIHYGRNVSAGLGVVDGGYTPTAGVQSYKQATASPKFIYTACKFTGPGIAATKTDQGAFVRAVSSETQRAMNDTKRVVNRQFHGDGRDVLAVLASAASTVAVLVDDGNDYVFTHLQAGVAVPVYVASSGTTPTVFNTVKTITLGSETSTAFNATLSAAVSTAVDGDILIAATGTGSNDTATLGRQMMGIAGIIGDSDVEVPDGGGALTGLHGLGVSAYPWWKAQVVGSDSSKTDLTFANLQKVFTKIASNSDGTENDIKFLLCSYQVRDKYVQLCKDERQIVNTMILDGGFKAVDFNGTPIVPDSQCKRGRMYFVNPSTLEIWRTEDFRWIPGSNGSVLDKVQGQDAFEATLGHYGDLICTMRNKNGVLLGINE